MKRLLIGLLVKEARKIVVIHEIYHDSLRAEHLSVGIFYTRNRAVTRRFTFIESAAVAVLVPSFVEKTFKVFRRVSPFENRVKYLKFLRKIENRIHFVVLSETAEKIVSSVKSLAENKEVFFTYAFCVRAHCRSENLPEFVFDVFDRVDSETVDIKRADPVLENRNKRVSYISPRCVEVLESAWEIAFYDLIIAVPGNGSAHSVVPVVVVKLCRFGRNAVDLRHIDPFYRRDTRFSRIGKRADFARIEIGVPFAVADNSHFLRIFFVFASPDAV